jgi:hypothetical protein
MHGNDHHLHWDFQPTGKNRDRRMDPVTVTPSPDITREWLQPRRARYYAPSPTGGQQRAINRSQKDTHPSM